MENSTATFIFIIVMLHIVAGIAYLAYKMRKK